MAKFMGRFVGGGGRPTVSLGPSPSAPSLESPTGAGSFRLISSIVSAAHWALASSLAGSTVVANATWPRL